MNTHTFSAIEAKAATEAGALDGFAARCECGYVAHSSLESLVRQYVREHATWVARKGAKR